MEESYLSNCSDCINTNNIDTKQKQLCDKYNKGNITKYFNIEKLGKNIGNIKWKFDTNKTSGFLIIKYNDNSVYRDFIVFIELLEKLCDYYGFVVTASMLDELINEAIIACPSNSFSDKEKSKLYDQSSVKCENSDSTNQEKVEAQKIKEKIKILFQCLNDSENIEVKELDEKMDEKIPKNILDLQIAIIPEEYSLKNTQEDEKIEKKTITYKNGSSEIEQSDNK